MTPDSGGLGGTWRSLIGRTETPGRRQTRPRARPDTFGGADMGKHTHPLPREAARAAAAADVCCALGAVLAHQREAAGLSQADLAAAVGVTQHVVSFWETGRAAIGADKLLMLAATLAIPAGALLADGWADASPCARLVVPPPIGDQPGPLRWRRPPRRPAALPAGPATDPPAGLEGRLVGAGLAPDLARRAADTLELGLEDGCGVGWQRGSCGRQPVLVAVAVNATRRCSGPARLIVRTVCRVHGEALDGRWVIVAWP